MMNMSSAETQCLIAVPVAALEYRDIAIHMLSSDGDEGRENIPSNGGANKRVPEVVFTEEEFAARLKRERTDATLQLEERLRKEYDQKSQAVSAAIGKAIAGFDAERDAYYSRVEAEIVQLALGIAAKILHREAQVDPMLVAALVRMAIEKMREGSSVTVRVSPGQATRWKSYFSRQSSTASVTVTEDAALTDQDCFLDTELGVANFGLDTQLKEVEQGFFDLLAQRPVNR
jgi:flagellar assembly protein FliH